MCASRLTCSGERAGWATDAGCRRAACGVFFALLLALFDQQGVVAAGPTLAVIGGSVRPDRSVTLIAQAMGNPVRLEAELELAGGETAPSWMTVTMWTVAATQNPRLEIVFSPPEDAVPGSYTIAVGATDGEGLTAHAQMTLEVLSPLCSGAVAFEENGACSDCPAHQVPNVSKTRCDPCPADSDRALDATACAACAAGLGSSPGEACGCGTASRLESGTCVDCPLHTDASENPLNCRACPDNQQRPAEAQACENCPAGETSVGGAACEPSSGPRLVLSVASTAVAEDAGSVAVTLTLRNPPAAGVYRNCGLDVVLGGTALQGADFQLSAKTERLRSQENWTATGTLTILNDALVEGDETLSLVGACLASSSRADPPHDQLPADELAITITDDESLPTLTFSVAPETIEESLGAQTVTVTASVDSAPATPLAVPLSFSGTATANEYAVEGTRSLTIAAGSLSGSRQLTITPLADQEADDARPSRSAPRSRGFRSRRRR